MANRPEIVISSLRGGQNDSDPPHILPDDQATLCENVEFFYTTLGERRLGCTAVDITDSGLDAEDGIVHLSTHMPLVDEPEVLDTQLFAIAASPNDSVTISLRDADGLWSAITPVDAFDDSDPEIFRIDSQSIHGKWFVAYKNAPSSLQRMHVWDGTVLRRTGLAQPGAAPTAANSGGAGTFEGIRLYRVRFITKNVDDEVILRSEPSEELEFTPSGSNASVTITRPSLIAEVETHWELEASDGDGNFYVIDTIAKATTTAIDTINPGSQYADPENDFALSEDIGDYELIPAVKFVKRDQDRLIFAGNWFEPEWGSRVMWTPVWQAPGVGNDERVPVDTDNFIDLDWMDGGEITGMSDPLNGSFYVFKWNRIYKLQRTGRVDAAYTAFLMSTQRGAVPGSIISGTDEYGRGCVYFLDPSVGPLRLSTGGLQYCQNLLGTWRRANTGAAQICAHGVYYPDKQQVHWWVAVDGEDKPILRVLLQVDQIRSDAEGTNRGWCTATGKSSEAWCSTIVPETVLDEETGSTTLVFRPYIGLPDPYYIQRMDSGHTDAGEVYVAKIVTKPYFITGLLNKWGAMTAALLAEPNEDPTTLVNVKFIRDFGRETNLVVTDFVPSADGESLVIKPFDNLRMSQSIAIQVEFSDYEEPDMSNPPVENN